MLTKSIIMIQQPLSITSAASWRFANTSRHDLLSLKSISVIEEGKVSLHNLKKFINNEF